MFTSAAIATEFTTVHFRSLYTADIPRLAKQFLAHTIYIHRVPGTSRALGFAATLYTRADAQ